MKKEIEMDKINLTKALRAHRLWLYRSESRFAKRADLSGANLSGADLSRANLSGADLSRADLTGTSGKFATGSFGRHHAIAAGGYISIGCERHTFAEWLVQYEEIGRKYDYTKTEIKLYGDWIKAVVSWLEGES